MEPNNLLETARQALLSDVVPELAGHARYTALMVAKAIAVHQRHNSQGLAPEPPSDLATLCQHIRAGHFDPGTKDHEVLKDWMRHYTDHALSISNPKFNAIHNKKVSS